MRNKELQCLLLAEIKTLKSLNSKLYFVYS